MKNVMKKISKRSLLGFIVTGVITGAITLLYAFSPIQQSTWTAPPSADKVSNPVTSNEKSIADGKALYGTNCKSCHGTKGKGDGPKSAELDKTPNDFTKEAFSKQTDGSLFWKITEGKKPMPNFKKELTDEQRWTVINYLRQLNKAGK